MEQRKRVALVGRANVGKSTLFNRLCGGRRALVANHPGLTRDRQYGVATITGLEVVFVDTAGLEPLEVSLSPAGEAAASAAAAAVTAAVAAQVKIAMDEADAAVLVVDARAGLAEGDRDIARLLRRRGIRVLVAANKVDGADPFGAHEFAALGFGAPWPVSASHGRGMSAFAEALAGQLAATPAPTDVGEDAAENALDDADERPRIAVVGRPNVGKSTLVNRWLGAERQVVLDQPGTTRDAVDIPFGHRLLIDTAGVRRRGKTVGVVEKFSVSKTLETLRRAHTAALVVDGALGVVEQDLHILQHAVQAGAGVAVAVNKCDGLPPQARARTTLSVRRRLAFAPWIPVHYISARAGAGVARLLTALDAIHSAGAFDVATADINRVLAEAVRAHPPPVVRSRQVKLRYAHKAGGHPPTILVHGTQAEALPRAYLRYLAGRFREAFQLTGLPVRIEVKSGANPYAGQRNELTRRQRKRRDRVIRHRRRS